MAFTIYEAGLCSECGQHITVCRDPANSFEVVEDTCGAKAEIDGRLREIAKAEPEPGLVIAAKLDDTPSVVRPPWEL